MARRRLPEADLCVGPIERLPWRDESFDLVTGFTLTVRPAPDR